MKIGQLISILEELKEVHGDVEFEFDWGCDTSPIEPELVTFDVYNDTYLLGFAGPCP